MLLPSKGESVRGLHLHARSRRWSRTRLLQPANSRQNQRGEDRSHVQAMVIQTNMQAHQHHRDGDDLFTTRQRDSPCGPTPPLWTPPGAHLWLVPIGLGYRHRARRQELQRRPPLPAPALSAAGRRRLKEARCWGGLLPQSCTSALAARAASVGGAAWGAPAMGPA